jgi:hypothetical protein
MVFQLIVSVLSELKLKVEIKNKTKNTTAK